MELFPYVLCRISGDDFDRFADFLQTPELDECFAAWQAGSKQRDELKLTASELLRKYNESLKNPKEQNDIQNFRRNLYNDRLIGESEWIRIIQFVPANLSDQLKAYRAVLDRLTRLRYDAECAYDRAVVDGRERVRGLVTRDSLKKGLLLASDSLYQQLARYIDTPQSEFGKRELQIEASLLQYLSRIFTKTSPLSTFTNLAMGRLHAISSKEPVVFSERPDVDEKVTSHVRLNNSLFHFLRVALSAYTPAMRNLPIKVNPTVVRSGPYYHFLINSQNIESFQQLSVNPLIEKIVGFLDAGTYVFGFLVKELIDSVQATEEELEKYVRQLASYGLLEFDFGISGIDPEWDRKLAILLRSWPEDPALCFRDMIQVIDQLQQLKIQYATSSVQDRKDILDQGYEIFKTMYLRLHEAAELPVGERHAMVTGIASPKPVKEDARPSTSFTHIESTLLSLKRENLFYEDTVRNINFVIDSEQLSRCVEKIDKLMHHSILLRSYEREQDRMIKFFGDKYGASRPIPVLEFYKDYYADVKKPFLASNAFKDKSGPEIIPEMFDRASDYATRLANHVSTQKGLPEIKFDNVALEESLPLEKSNSPDARNSYGAFLQFYCDKHDGRFKVVVNRTFPGYGKMLSRFLHLFDNDVIEAIRSWNANLAAPAELFIENCDASFYNANIHPCLMANEVRLPGSHNSLPAEQQLDVSQFEVVSDQPNSIAIYHKPSGKKSYFFDLAFQASAGRSNLFQLLQTFSKAEYLYINPLCYVINDATRAEYSNNQIQVVPRIVYEDTIVIQRKSWIIPRVHLPFKIKSESDADFYLRLNAWRLKYGIPDEVFVIARQRSEGRNNPEKGKDDYKPQYVNFRNPFFVRLVSKVLDKVVVALMIQEMLPTSEQLFQINGHRYVSEFVVQWYEF